MFQTAARRKSLPSSHATEERKSIAIGSCRAAFVTDMQKDSAVCPVGRIVGAVDGDIEIVSKVVDLD
jgi:hypothetical protein